MTDSPTNISTQPGWYPDPSGMPRMRWWDGAQWTEHLHDPSLETFGVMPPVVLGPDTPVYNPLIWTIVLLPIVSLMVSSSIDMNSYLTQSASGLPVFDPLYVVSQCLAIGIYLATVLFAFYDRRALIAAGFVRPFHWAWAFLSTGVYIIGRSVIVRRRAGRGLAPIWVWLAVTVISTIVAFSRVISMLPSMTSNLPG